MQLTSPPPSTNLNIDTKTSKHGKYIQRKTLHGGKESRGRKKNVIKTEYAYQQEANVRKHLVESNVMQNVSKHPIGLPYMACQHVLDLCPHL